MTVPGSAVTSSSDLPEPEALHGVIAEGFDEALFPRAVEVASGVLVYDATEWQGCDGDRRRGIRAELAAALSTGPGVFLLRGAFADTSVIDDASEVFRTIIARESAEGGEAGDHFGKPGANARIWNAQQKLAREAPQVFARYFANDAIALASEAWLGPAYQMTSQVNLIHPGGAAQEPHCDYHLGFLGDVGASAYPSHVHRMSAMLTLQGAVAHVDMPVESGTTMLLPNSQRFAGGYVHYGADAVKDVFASHMVQLPLAKGDVLFFSPALIHGGGTNRTSDVERMANLLQVSSAFGRAMEILDRRVMCEAVYPELLSMVDEGWPDWAVANTIASCAEGYAFPTDLDRDQPMGGLAPESQAQVLARSVVERVSPADLSSRLLEWQVRRCT
jgi:ectoine hydroxylase-related dioxygenase (phytanoyl-CoA dioxygenase family)